MDRGSDLSFLITVLEKCRLQVRLVDPDAPPEPQLDLGLRTLLGGTHDSGESLLAALRRAEHNVIYRLRDSFACSYLFFRLPEQRRILTVGPYLAETPNRERLLEQAERLGLHPRFFSLLERYYEGLPVLLDESPVYAVVNTFGERLWGGADAFTLLDVNREIADLLSRTFSGAVSTAEETSASMRLMEERYRRENDLMSAIAKGQLQRLDGLMAGFSSWTMENRVADPVRNLKNYCIIINTLARKAAEQGGVAPLYLDRKSSDFARRIEAVTSVAAGSELMAEMLRSYCRMVRRHTGRKYSAPVQRAIVVIDAELSGDLSLRRLADLQKLNASYLSALFKKETGKSLTDYVTQKRMELAAQLLATTSLQVQTIAQHCGIGDVNYFSKLFKKHLSLTPKEYRRKTEAVTGSRRSDRPGD